MKNHVHLLLLIGALAIFFNAGAIAQTSTLQIENFQVEQAKLPGAQRPWSKLICTLNNAGNWADGISFNYTVLVEEPSHPESRRILAGGVTYSNIPTGKSQAIIYLSPNAVARYGTPVVATVQLDRGERTIQTYQWTGKTTAPADWAGKYPTLNGILLNMRSTPWILLDSERGGDLLVN